MRRPWRVPILLLVPAFVIGASFVQGHRSTTAASTTRLDAATPTVAAADAPSSTWYCAAGSATTAADAFAEQSVTVTNTGSEDATGFVTAFSDTGTQASRTIAVKAHGSTTVRTSDVLKAPWAAVVVEVAGGGIAVAQELRGTAGRAVVDCASSPSSNWWFPAGTSRAGARILLALFNPFPGEATVDLSFDTEDGSRTPQEFQGLVVRGGHLTMVDVSSVVTLRERVSTTVAVRAGRVVATELLATDGRNGTEAGLTAVAGATVTAPVWTFPVATPASSTAKELVAITNPGSSDVDVQVEILLDDPATNGSVEPFLASVPARRTVVVDLGADARIPRSAGRWLIVRTPGGEPIVAARTVGAARTASSGGLATSVGIPVVATRWIGAMPVPSDTSPALLSIVNPSASLQAIVSLTVHDGGRSRAATTVTRVVVAPGQRLVVDLQKSFTTRPDGPFEVSSDVPVVVGQWFTFSVPLDLSTMDAYPVAGTASFPVDVYTPEAFRFVDTGTRSDDTVVPEATSTTTTAATAASIATTTSSVAAN